MANRYDPPIYIPETPALNPVGYPEPISPDIEPVYWPDGRLRGVDYLTGGQRATPSQVDAGLYDMTLRRYYDAWRRLGRLVFLAVGPLADQGLNADEGQALIDQHFAGIFELPATVDGGVILATWDAGDVDLWALGLDYGCAVSDAPWPGGAPHPTASVAQIAGLERLGDGAARITPNKALNIDRHGAVYVVIEARPPQFPKIPLTGETGGPWRPDPAEITRFFLGRGGYVRATGDIIGGVPVNVIGRDDYESIGQLIGLPGTRRLQIGASNDYRLKIYYGFGALKDRTGDQVEHFDEFLSFIEFDQGTDNVGLLAKIGAQMADPAKGIPVKKSPAGGNLDPTEPGYYFERAIARRVGTQGVGEISAIGGPGEAEVQRARSRQYLSVEFDADSPGEYLTGESHLIVGAGGAAEWRLPAFCDSRSKPEPRTFAKAVSGTVAAIEEVAAGIWAIEFDLALRSLAVSTPGDPDPPPITYHSGGNVVCPDLALEVDNPGSGALLGDRQRLICPGDVIQIRGARGIVTSAEAFGGSEDLSGDTLPEFAPPGVPEALYAVYRHRDRITIQVEGPSGDGWGDVGPGDPIEGVSLSAISPEGETLTLESWDPVGEVWIPLEHGDDYDYDPITGNVQVFAGPLIGATRLRASGEFFDRRRLYPCEVANVLHGALDGACEGFLTLQSDPSPGRALTLNGSTTWGIDGIGIDVYSDSPIGGSDADDIADVREALVHDPDPLPGWTFAPSSGGGTQGVEGSASGFRCTNSFAFYANLFGVVPPVPSRWTSGEIAEAVCDLTIFEPALYTQDTQPIFPDPVTDFNGLRLAGYIVRHDPDTGEVLSIRDAGFSIPMAGLTYIPEAGETPAQLRGTVDVTAIMQGLAGTYAEDETPFIAIVGPGGDASIAGTDPRDLFSSWFLEYTRDSTRDWDAYIDASDKGNPYWIVQRIVHAGLTAQNWRVRPSAANLAAARYAGDGAPLSPP